MKNFLFFLFSFLLLSTLSAQPSIEWQKCYGGTNSEEAHSIQQTSDGGYIVASVTNTNNNGDVTGYHGGGGDYWIVKLNSDGSIQWQKSLGGTGLDNSYCIRQTANGGYIVAGQSNSNDGDVSGNHGSNDCWVVKLTSTGSIQWQKSLGGTGNDRGYSIQQTADGGYIVAGTSDSNDGDVSGNHGGDDYWIVKLTSTGSIQWQKSLGGAGYDISQCTQQTADGGYIVAGQSNSNDGDVSGNHGSNDYWVVKLTSTGSIQWQKALGGSADDNFNYWGEAVKQTADGGYIVAGSSYSNDGDVSVNHGSNDYWVVKLTSTGSIQWQKALGGTSSEHCKSIQQTSEGGYMVAGFTYSNNGDVSGHHGFNDYWIVKLNSNGSIQWQKALGGTGVERGNSIKQTADGGYIIAGISQSNDEDVSGNHGGSDAWIVKLYSSPVDVKDIHIQVAQMEVFPNPADQLVSVKVSLEEPIITVSLYNLLGQQVSHQTILNGGSVSVSQLANGLYLLTANTHSGEVFSNKIWKQD